jgi:HlyD family secretion protein
VKFRLLLLVSPLAALAACGPAERGLVLVGSVERTMVELVAPTSEVLVSIAARRGEPVKPGELLVQLDPTLARAEVARAEAVLAGARTAEELAEHELRRRTALHRSDVASEEALEQAQLRRADAEASLREAEASLDAARKRVADLSLASPVAGVLDQLPFEVGERVPAGATVAVVLDEAAPWVRVWVPEAHVASVRPGSAAEIRIDGIATPLRGHVLDVAHQASYTPHYALTERERVYLVYETRVAIDDAPPGLRPGVPAHVVLDVPPGAPR